MSTTSDLCLDSLCTILSAAADGKDMVGEGQDQNLVRRHVAFALGEMLLERITTGKRHHFTLTPRGVCVRDLLCDAQRRPDIQAMLVSQNGFGLANWLEARFPFHHRQA